MWSSRPFTRILMFFISGIILARYLTVITNINSNYYLIISVILLIAAFFVTLISKSYFYKIVPGILLGIIITTLAIYITSEKNQQQSYLTKRVKGKLFIASVISNPIETDQSIKSILQISMINHDSSVKIDTQKIISYFKKDSLSKQLKYGDRIVFKSSLSIPNKPMNPGEFDYKNYLLQNGINYTTYLSPESWELIDYHPDNYFIAIAGKIRKMLLLTLSQNGLTGQYYSVAAAILLGYDDSMELELKQDFIMAGAMHILCVSGLHVGIIYLVFNFLLGFLRQNKTNKIIKALTLLVIVWSYAMITGLSPSVQRAGLMISIFIIGNLLSRNRDTYNTLAISAFILLLFQPNLLFNTGFQLSYAAVLGIITFHQPLYNLIHIKNSLLDKIWSITVLSIAAQLATFPIAIYYFHFFPTWFWLTNLFTFPLSFLIIVTGLLFVVVSWIPLISTLIGKILSGMIFILIKVVGSVKNLPFSGIYNIYESFSMLISVYLLIILTYFLISNKKIRIIIPVLISILTIATLSTVYKFNILTQKKVIIYSTNNHGVYEFIDGKNQLILTDSSLAHDKSKVDFHLKTSRAIMGIGDSMITFPTEDTLLLTKVKISELIITYEGITFLIIDGNHDFYPINKKLKLDFVVLSGKQKTDISKLINIFSFNKVVIDPTVPNWNASEIKASCKILDLKVVDVKKDGAMVLNI